MQYDPSETALLHPEQQPALLNKDKKWTSHAICAELSRLVYWRFEQGDQSLAALENILAHAQMGKPQLFKNADSSTQAFAVSSADGNTTYLSFRGTQADDMTDLITDIRFFPAEWNGRGKVHSGFLAAFQSIEKELDVWFRQCPANTVWICGHSLGAALATLAAARYPGTRLVNFGSPCVGDAEFAASFTGREVARYVNCADFVTKLPPESSFYQHLQGMRYIDRNGVMPPGMSSTEMEADQDVAATAYTLDYATTPGNVPFRNMADHAPINYVRALLGEL
ncbi:lipase family protein [Undibacterium sp. CY18W]|uniref:Lipase family protein n=1 Tax=Undibacterium hunanense TaxID=2762292 RepID=A0ABR6ZY87_9BURK|nr:lipase family protein [Undibacterium hunanense]MBC3920827.1 lipase family protein [Undibacterium hunanense]